MQNLTLAYAYGDGQGKKLRIHGGCGIRPIRRTEDRVVSGGRHERNPHAER